MNITWLSGTERLPGECHLQAQGFPLPQEWPFKGEWIWQDTVFLYRKPKAPGEDDTGPRPSAVVHRDEGRLCVGICAEDLAAQLDLPTEDVIAHNRAGSLHMLTKFSPAEVSKAFRFRIGSKVAFVLVDHGGRGEEP